MTHNIIKTENYLLVVDDSEIKEGDWHMYSNKDGSLNGPYGVRKFLHNDYRYLNAYKCKKLISHLPLNNSPVLEFVPLLPPLEDDVDKLSEQEFPYIKDSLVQTTKSEQNKHTDTLRWGFKKGYNKAKENYNADLGELLSDFYLFATNGEVCDHEVINEFIQSLQQPKMPVEFECEEIYCGYMEDEALMKPKTTTNPQGQTVLVGKYIY